MKLFQSGSQKKPQSTVDIDFPYPFVSEPTVLVANKDEGTAGVAEDATTVAQIETTSFQAIGTNTTSDLNPHFEVAWLAVGELAPYRFWALSFYVDKPQKRINHKWTVRPSPTDNWEAYDHYVHGPISVEKGTSGYIYVYNYSPSSAGQNHPWTPVTTGILSISSATSNVGICPFSETMIHIGSNARLGASNSTYHESGAKVPYSFQVTYDGLTDPDPKMIVNPT